MLKKIFSSRKQTVAEFKRAVASQSQLVYLVELRDGQKFGAYRHVSHPPSNDRVLVFHDENAFMFVEGQKNVFPSTQVGSSGKHPGGAPAEGSSRLAELGLSPAEARRRSICVHFDTSPQYLLSVGNSYNYDGFWFGQDFEKVNPDLTTRVKTPEGAMMEIWTNQFSDMFRTSGFRLRTKDNRVAAFKVFQCVQY